MDTDIIGKYYFKNDEEYLRRANVVKDPLLPIFEKIIRKKSTSSGDKLLRKLNTPRHYHFPFYSGSIDEYFYIDEHGEKHPGLYYPFANLDEICDLDRRLLLIKYDDMINRFGFEKWHQNLSTEQRQYLIDELAQFPQLSDDEKKIIVKAKTSGFKTDIYEYISDDRVLAYVDYENGEKTDHGVIEIRVKGYMDDGVFAEYYFGENDEVYYVTDEPYPGDEIL